MSLRARVLAMVQQQPMTTDQLVQELGIARSTVASALKDLKRDCKVCVARYEYTGVKPVTYWGAGVADADRPSTQTREQRNAKKREWRRRAREQAEQLSRTQEWKPRRDIAASWI